MKYGIPATDVGFDDLKRIADMSYPMACTRCGHIHDAASVDVVQRYSDCSTWRCPQCRSLIDDRPLGWGGSAVRVRRDGSWIDGR